MKFVGLLEKYATVKCSPASPRIIKLEMRLKQLVTIVNHMGIQEVMPVHPFQLEEQGMTVFLLEEEQDILQGILTMNILSATKTHSQTTLRYATALKVIMLGMRGFAQDTKYLKGETSFEYGCYKSFVN